MRYRIASILTVLLLLLPTWQATAQVSDWPRKVVITNDDGIDDDGLIALATVFASVTETFVIAPMDNRSGSTNYVSAIATRSITVERRDLGPGITAYAVDGYPADAVVFALAGLLADDPPDLVISGINNGTNVSDEAYLSGTVGAARMAAFAGIPAIAVSGHNNEPETLDAIARWVVELARTTLVRELEPRQYLTVSVPRIPLSEIKGAEIVRRGPWPYTVSLERDADFAGRSGQELWRLSFSARPVARQPGTDIQALGENHIAIVPMRIDEHDYGLLETLLATTPDLPAWPPDAGRR